MIIRNPTYIYACNHCPYYIYWNLLMVYNQINRFPWLLDYIKKLSVFQLISYVTYSFCWKHSDLQIFSYKQLR